MTATLRVPPDVSRLVCMVFSCEYFLAMSIPAALFRQLSYYYIRAEPLIPDLEHATVH